MANSLSRMTVSTELRDQVADIAKILHLSINEVVDNSIFFSLHSGKIPNLVVFEQMVVRGEHCIGAYIDLPKVTNSKDKSRSIQQIENKLGEVFADGMFKCVDSTHIVIFDSADNMSSVEDKVMAILQAFNPQLTSYRIPHITDLSGA